MHLNKSAKVGRRTLLSHYFSSFTKLPEWASQIESKYFFIELAWWKIKNNEEAMCDVPLCTLFSVFLIILTNFFTLNTRFFSKVPSTERVQKKWRLDNHYK